MHRGVGQVSVSIVRTTAVIKCPEKKAQSVQSDNDIEMISDIALTSAVSWFLMAAVNTQWRSLNLAIYVHRNDVKIFGLGMQNASPRERCCLHVIHRKHLERAQ